MGPIEYQVSRTSMLYTVSCTVGYQEYDYMYITKHVSYGILIRPGQPNAQKKRQESVESVLEKERK